MTEEYDGILNPIDRRCFLKKAGVFAAASMLCGTMTSCANDGIDIPCLGPADPPVPVTGMTYIRASQIGCALDCNLKTGRNKLTGGSATDDGPKINAAMAGASATNPITLIIDGSALISGLFLPADGHWAIAGLGCGTGFFIKSGANNDGIHNGPPDASIPFDPGPPAPPRGLDVSLSNFTINGNQKEVSTAGIQQGSKVAWFCGINLMNLDNISITNVVVVNTPAYHIRLSNVGDVSVSGSVLQGKGPNTDGLHFDGPANDITIANCSFKIDEDSIALNCPEGHSGNISRVAVTGCTFDSVSLMRLYTTNGSAAKFRIDSVTVDNCKGTLTQTAFFIGFVSSASLPDSVSSLTISNCNLTAPMILAVAENFGTVVLQNVVFVPSPSDIVWNPLQVNRTSAFVRPSPISGALAFKGASLAFQNCRIYRTRNVNVTAAILESQSSIDNLEFDGFALLDAGLFSPISSLLNAEGGAVGQLVLNSLDATNIKAPVEAGGFSEVGTVSGKGVLGTGWKFPDEVMANGVPYISASTGRPSIKVAEAVEPYP